jgi:hypothetical protein
MLLEEIYLLTKHGNFTAEYIEKIPVYKRRFYLFRMKDEYEEIKEYQEKIKRQNKISARKPRR